MTAKNQNFQKNDNKSTTDLIFENAQLGLPSEHTQYRKRRGRKQKKKIDRSELTYYY